LGNKVNLFFFRDIHRFNGEKGRKSQIPEKKIFTRGSGYGGEKEGPDLFRKTPLQ